MFQILGKKQSNGLLLVFTVVLLASQSILSTDSSAYLTMENIVRVEHDIDVSREIRPVATPLFGVMLEKKQTVMQINQETAELIINATHVQMTNEDNKGISSVEAVFRFTNGTLVSNSTLQIEPLDYPETYYQLPFSVGNVSEGKWQLIFEPEKRNGLIPGNYTYVLSAKGGTESLLISKPTNFTLEILDTPDTIPPTFELRITGDRLAEGYYNITTQRLNISLHVKDTRKVYHTFINSTTTSFLFPSLPVTFEPVEKSYNQKGVIYYVWYNQTDMFLNYSIPPNWIFLGTWEGDEVFTIVVSDLAGNTNMSKPFRLFGDNKPPSIQFLNTEEMDATVYSPEKISLNWEYADMHPVRKFVVWVDTDGDQQVDTIIADQYKETSITFAMPSNFSISGADSPTLDNLREGYYPFFIQIEGQDMYGNIGVAGRSIKINITSLLEKSSSGYSGIGGETPEKDNGETNNDGSNSVGPEIALQGLIPIIIIFSGWLIIRKRYTHSDLRKKNRASIKSIRGRRKKKNRS